MGATRWIASIRPTKRETDCSGLRTGDACVKEGRPPAKGMSRVELPVLETTGLTVADAADGYVRVGAAAGAGDGEGRAGDEPPATRAGSAIKLDPDVGGVAGTWARAEGAGSRRSKT